MLPSIVLLNALACSVVFSTQTVVVEPKAKLIPGGPGQKPFNVARHIIPLSQIQGGGPPRDGIPALVEPRFVPAAQGNRWLRDSDRVLGVFFTGVAKAYPVRILNWHELVNDVVAGRPILVSW